MTTQTVPLDKILNNPWQTRLGDDPEHIQRLAEDIKANGMLQTPLARSVNGHYELAFGHSRLAAWKLARPSEPFPLDVKPLSDRQLSDFAASENAQRKNLTPIETATAIQRRMKDFGLNQIDAGKPFGYTSQGAVSNLLRLLKLPEHTRGLVHSGELPERIARTLIHVARLSQTDADKIADKIVKAEPADRDDEAERSTSFFFNQQGRALNWRTPWKMEWPPKPLPVPPELAKGIGGAPAEVPACKGCEFKVDVGRDDGGYCTRPPCFDVKWRMALQAELRKASARLGIAVAGPAEKVTLVYDGTGYDYVAQKNATRLLSTKSDILRLALYTDDERGSGRSTRDTVFGSEHVMLLTTNKAEADRFMATKSAQKARELAQANETEAQKAKRVEREEASREAGQQERSRQFRARADINWLIATAGVWLGRQLDASGGALEFLALEVEKQYQRRGNTSLFDSAIVEHRQELDKAIKAATDVRSGGKARELLLRQRIVVDILTHEIAESYQEPWYGWGRALNVVAGVVEKGFHAKLPAGWNEPPIHHGPTNCWQCGRFGSNIERITKGELAKGWIIVPDGVFCSLDHQKEYHAAQRKAPGPMKSPAELRALLIKRGMRVPKKSKAKT